MQIYLKDVNKNYFHSGNEVPVLKGVSLTAQKGDSIAILGPSGSGKSTLLNIMGALDFQSSGTVKLEGDNLIDKTEKELSVIRNKKIGFIFQLHHLLPQCTALENVLVPTLPYRKPYGKKDEKEQDLQKALELLNRVGLKDRINYRPAFLSGGECQRIAVVRALINDPAILLADEPTGSLDEKSSMNLAVLIKELNEERNLTIILVSHSEKIASYMKKSFFLSDGILK